jgi:hypothetical protein
MEKPQSFLLKLHQQHPAASKTVRPDFVDCFGLVGFDHARQMQV